MKNIKYLVLLLAMSLLSFNAVSSANLNLHVVQLRHGDASYITEILHSVLPNQKNSNLVKNSEQTNITADPITNTLVIQASPRAYKNIRKIVDKLDVKPAQVMIEAMVAKIDQPKEGTFGIQWLVGAGNENMGSTVMRNDAGAEAAGAGNVSVSKEVNVGLVAGTTTVGGQTISSLDALADMLKANNNTNNVSQITLITMNNAEAQITVGTESGVVGTNLKVKPLITENGSLRLEVCFNDSERNTSTESGATVANITTQMLRTTLAANDGQITAVGGVTADTYNKEKNTHNKTNLVLFLRPTIIKENMDPRSHTPVLLP